MKKIFLLSMAAGSSLLITAQTYSWQWAETASQYNFDTAAYADAYSSYTTTDVSGNVITTGWTLFDSITFSAYTLYNPYPNGASLMYLVKYDPQGHVLWATSVTGTLEQNSLAVTTDKDENIYVVGEYYSPYLVFGTDTLFQTGPPCGLCRPSSSNGFVFKYNPSGNVIWAKTFGGPRYAALSGVSADTSGNLCISGWFNGDSAVFGELILHDSTGTGLNNSVLIKCDSSGHVIWEKSSAWAVFLNMASDPSGNTILNGAFFGSDTITFGTHKVVSIDNVITGATQDYFVVKYDDAGNSLWAANTGLSGSNSQASGASSDLSGNTFLTGFFVADSVTIGGQVLHGDNTGGYYYFITKYDTGGNVVWVRGAEGLAYGEAPATDAAGNTWVAGNFFTSVRFGSDVLYNPDSATSPGHIFLIEYDANGTVISAGSFGGSGNDGAVYLAIDASGNLYLTGYFGSDSIAFGTNILYNSNHDTAYLPFVAKYAVTPSSISGPVLVQDNLINVFPNPSRSGQWTLQVSSNLLGSSAELFDVGGKLLYKTELNDLTTSLNLSVAPGVYLLTTTSQDARIVKKLVRL